MATETETEERTQWHTVTKKKKVVTKRKIALQLETHH